jgi:glycosyltransferase involved in cell wall biosynthesis
MGQEGWRIAQEKFSLSGMIKKTEELYLDLPRQGAAQEQRTILFTSTFNSLQGGGQRSLLLLLKFLKREKFKPLLIVPDEGELAEEATKLGIRYLVFTFPRLRSIKIWRPLVFFFRLLEVIKEHNVNIIHTDSPREAFYCGLAGRIAGVAVILHARVRESTQPLDRILYWAVDSIIAVSQTVAGRFAFARNNSKVVVVYNGVDLEEYKPAGQEEKRGVFRIGYFGRIHPRKGIEVLIQAMPKLRGEVELVIQGDGDTDYVASLKNLAKGYRIEFRSYNRDPRKDMAGVDAIVLPSIQLEGFSRVILEAMAMGKIIIASDLAENKEAIGGDSALLTFPVGSVKELVSIIEAMIQNKVSAADLGMRLRKRAETLFDARKSAARIEKIYDMLLAQAGSRICPRDNTCFSREKSLA